MTHSSVRSLRIFVAIAALAFTWSAAPAPARAQDGATIGLGATAFLTQSVTGGPSVPALQAVYDTGAWHAEGLFGLSGDAIRLLVGARGWYHFHISTAADFSLGGGLGIIHFDEDAPGRGGFDDDTAIMLEGGAQIRAFIVDNVAVSGSMGLGIALDDDDNNDEVVLGGQLLSSLGVTYYFR